MYVSKNYEVTVIILAWFMIECTNVIYKQELAWFMIEFASVLMLSTNKKLSITIHSYNNKIIIIIII